MDVSVMINNTKFNYRVATLIKSNNKILLHKNKEDDFYAIPGGRIMIGETSENALKRVFDIIFSFKKSGRKSNSLISSIVFQINSIFPFPSNPIILSFL